MRFLADTWGAVWPNLLASVLWVAPAWWAHRRLITTQFDQQLDSVRSHVEEHVQHVLDRFDEKEASQ